MIPELYLLIGRINHLSEGTKFLTNYKTNKAFAEITSGRLFGNNYYTIYSWNTNQIVDEFMYLIS